MDSQYVVPPMSRNDLRKQAMIFRRMFRLDNQIYVPIIKLLELLPLHTLNGYNFEYGIVGQGDLGNKHGETSLCGDTILIALREDVYDQACRRRGRDRYTVAHEIGHAVLHTFCTPKLARLEPGYEPKAFEKPEWQADAFAGELLVHALLCNGMSVDQIVKACGVSYAAASTQYRVMHR